METQVYNFKIIKAIDTNKQFMVGMVFINCRMTEKIYNKFKKDFCIAELSERDIETYLMVKDVRDTAYLTPNH